MKIIGAHFLEAVNYVLFASLSWNRMNNDRMQGRKWAILSEGIISINISVCLIYFISLEIFFSFLLSYSSRKSDVFFYQFCISHFFNSPEY